MNPPSLSLDIAKVKVVLEIAPKLTLTEAVNWTIAWYRAHERGGDARQLCLANLDKFSARLNRPAAADLATAL